MPKRKADQPSKGNEASPQKGLPGGLSDAEWDKLPQRERFLRMAHQLGCEENLDRFDEAVKRIGEARRQPQAARKAGKENKP